MASGRYDIVIVGGGFAGAATAFHLSRSARGTIAVVEREPTPGAHASGRNASLLRLSEADPFTRRLAVASARAYRENSGALDLRQVGSILVGSARALQGVRAPDLLPSRHLDRPEVEKRVPALAGSAFEAALLTPGDGVLDPWSLLSFYLSEAGRRGVELLCDWPVETLEAGTAWRLAGPRGTLEAGRLVDAAGAWAAPLAAAAARPAAPLVPWKRHLFLLDTDRPEPPAQPFAWNLDHAFYLRPESGGLLFSICDEEPSDSLEETVTAGITEALAERILAHLPALAGARVRRAWSCFRTKSPDARFVIGADPRTPTFFWVAGLGGSGMTCSWEVGRIAADAILERRAPPPEVDPARFLRASTGGPSHASA